MRFTPGPWELVPDEDRGVAIQARNASPHETHIAYVQFADAGLVAQANARLIVECPAFYDLAVAVLALSSNPVLLDKAGEILSRLE